jgi:iron(III) transport system ATP-binding protein
MSTLELNAVSKAFASQPAADAVSLTVASGSRTAIVGPSGSGKTTLLRMIAGFEFPDRGSIVLDGTPLFDGCTTLPAHRRQIGYVPQDGALFSHLRVADNIGFGLTGPKVERRARVEALLDQVALPQGLIDRWPHELSGGQQQRVALARALAQRPRLMLLDEPFSALDTGLRAAMRKAVTRILAEAGITTILVTHDQAEALSFADQLAVMREGKLVQAGSPQNLYHKPVDEQTAYFLGEALILPASVGAGQAICELGRIEVDMPLVSPHARIMLRPEQLRLLTEAAGEGAMAEVLGSEFNGSYYTLSLRLHDSGQPLTLRMPTGVELAHGALVKVGVSGKAHVFDT